MVLLFLMVLVMKLLFQVTVILPLVQVTLPLIVLAYFNSFDDTYPTVLSKLVGDLSWIVRVKNNGKVVWYS